MSKKIRNIIVGVIAIAIFAIGTIKMVGASSTRTFVIDTGSRYRYHGTVDTPTGIVDFDELSRLANESGRETVVCYDTETNTICWNYTK